MWDLAISPYLMIAWAAVEFVLNVIVSIHIVIWKRSSKAAAGWIGLVWFTPLIGVLLYLLLGINRIQRRAQRLRPRMPSVSLNWPESVEPTRVTLSIGIRELIELGGNVTGLPLVAGNSVRVLVNGENAYPAMLSAIQSAKRSISMATYIFENDQIGQRFVKSLGDAVARGVAVRVLVDSVGSRYGLGTRYNWRTIVSSLRGQKVPVATFLPSLFPWEFRYANLRNHRKLIVVDAEVAFVGGMNIRASHDLTLNTRNPIQDTHFQVEGPLIAQIQETFAVDWRFTTGEVLDESVWFTNAQTPPNGSVAGRCIADGPDESLDRIRKMFHGAISVAQQSITIVTPYFLPDEALVSALSVAALRGVRVDIVLPRNCNLRFVQWAAMAQLWQVLEPGCHVWLSAQPFDHSKFLVVDGEWSLIGSANWDPRSLRLNFEMNCELYSSSIAQQLLEIAQNRIRLAHPLTLNEVNARPLIVKIRDGLTRLFTPYL